VPAGPDVTVVIPTRDRWHLLAPTLASALAQEDVAIEVIVVDNGSHTPVSAALSGLDDPRVSVLVDGSGPGPAQARNAGLAAARGEWTAFLDDDDLWAPHKLRAQVDAAKDAAAAFAYASALVVDPEGRVLREARAPTGAELDRTLTDYCAIPAGASNVLVSTATLRGVGGFDENLFHLADWDLWVRLRAMTPPAVCSEPLVGYVQHPQNMRATAGRDVAAELAHFDAKHLGGKAPGPARAWVWRWIADGHRAAGRRLTAARLELWASRRYGDPPGGGGGRSRALASLLGEGWMRRAQALRRAGAGPAAAPPWACARA
jgi:glycosyltransferase involved in cell wall biosynthesis